MLVSGRVCSHRFSRFQMADRFTTRLQGETADGTNPGSPVEVGS